MKIFKRISAITLACVITFTLEANISASESRITIDDYCASDNYTLEGLKQLFPDYYKCCHDNYVTDMAEINEIYANLDQLLKEGKEIALNDVKKNEPSTRNTSLGTYGDILVNLTIDSGSFGFAGHAAIVSSSSSYTIESYAQSWSPINMDGVQIYDNNWGATSGSLLVRPYNATSSQYTTASSFAINKVGLPYNWNFLDKTTTSKYYCSQLVWQAWNYAGINTETGSVPNAIIAPADLVNSSNTYIVEHIT